MSMVTLHNEIKNYNLPRDTEVLVRRVTSKGDVLNMYPHLKECPLKDFLDNYTGEVMTLETFIELCPSVANGFEWAMSKDHKTLTHFEFGLIKLKENHKLFIGKYLHLDIQES